MIKDNLIKRILTSIILFSILISMFISSFLMIIFLIIILAISWVEFNGLISKIFINKKLKHNLIKFIFRGITFLYLLTSVIFIFLVESWGSQGDPFKLYIFYSILVSITSDIGGFVIGKTFKGKKLSKISPNKTYSGSIGSFIFSIFLIFFFKNYFSSLETYSLVIITLLISLISQLGDLFISYLKRTANVKDTSNLLPGHGGLLDRIDGILFAVPFGTVLIMLFI